MKTGLSVTEVGPSEVGGFCYGQLCVCDGSYIPLVLLLYKKKDILSINLLSLLWTLNMDGCVVCFLCTAVILG